MSKWEFEWRFGRPEEAGMDSQKLEEAQKVLTERNTAALIVVRNDKIVWEWYAPGHGPDTRQGLSSVSKGLVAATSLLTAINDGYIGLDDYAADYIPGWRGHPLKSKITIRHLISHTSGMEDAKEPGKTHAELTGWKGAFWRRDPDPFSIAIHEAPIIFEPGTTFVYSNPGYAALAYAVTKSLQNSPYPDIELLLRDRIMRPMGVPDDAWSVGYGEKPVVDGMRLVGTWGGGSFTARAAAAVGRLMLRRGEWEGRQLLKPETVDLGVTVTGTPITGPGRPDASKLSPQAVGWANNSNNCRAPLPRDAFFSDGAGHRFIFVVPSLDLIVFRGGQNLDNGDFWPIQKYLINPILAAIKE